MRGFEIRSQLGACADDVWAEALTASGINYELAPWLAMTMPGGRADLSADSVQVGEPLGRSWILLAGFIPIEYDDITLAALDPHGFVERSSMLMQRVWHHERRIEPDGDRCLITDRIGWLPRLPGADLPLVLFAPLLFRHRHARLRRRYGGELVGAARIEIAERRA